MPRQEEPAVVNLRQARKQKARAGKDISAAQNRVLHGRTKFEKIRDRIDAEKSAAFLEAHRRQPPGKDG